MAIDGLTGRINSYFFGKMYHDSKTDPKSLRVIDWCQKAGLIAKAVKCPHCKSDMKLRYRFDSSDKYEWLCKKSGHVKKVSIRKGSLFQGSRLSIPKILLLTWYWVNETPNKCVLNEMDCSCGTVTDWFRVCREVCLEDCLMFDGKIGGDGKIVEIDESLFGERQLKREKHADGKWVYVGVEWETEKSFMVVVPNKSEASLLKVISERIIPGTTIVSDCWESYNHLENESFLNLATNHNLYFKDNDAGAHTSSNEKTRDAVKHSQKRTHMAKDQFDSYFAEYIWRKQHNFEIQRKFVAFLETLSKVFPLGVSASALLDDSTTVPTFPRELMDMNEN